MRSHNTDANIITVLKYILQKKLKFVMGLGSILDAILDFCECWNKSNMYTFQIYIFIIWIGAYNLCKILKQCITSLKTWNSHYRTERNIQPINMVHYIPRPSAIFNDILTQNSPIYGSLHTRVHHKYSRNQYCVVHAILLLRSHFYIVNSYFAAILVAILKKNWMFVILQIVKRLYCINKT